MQSHHTGSKQLIVHGVRPRREQGKTAHLRVQASPEWRWQGGREQRWHARPRTALLVHGTGAKATSCHFQAGVTATSPTNAPRVAHYRKAGSRGIGSTQQNVIGSCQTRISTPSQAHLPIQYFSARLYPTMTCEHQQANIQASEGGPSTQSAQDRATTRDITYCKSVVFALSWRSSGPASGPCPHHRVIDFIVRVGSGAHAGRVVACMRACRWSMACPSAQW